MVLFHLCAWRCAVFCLVVGVSACCVCFGFSLVDGFGWLFCCWLSGGLGLLCNYNRVLVRKKRQRLLPLCYGLVTLVNDSSLAHLIAPVGSRYMIKEGGQLAFLKAIYYRSSSYKPRLPSVGQRRLFRPETHHPPQ